MLETNYANQYLNEYAYTKTPKNACKNKGSRNWRFLKWSLLKMRRFWCGHVKTEAFKNSTEFSVIYCCFHERFRAFSMWTTGEKVSKKVCFFEWKRISVDRWKQNENASVVENIFLRVRRDENAWVQSVPYQAKNISSPRHCHDIHWSWSHNSPKSYEVAALPPVSRSKDIPWNNQIFFKFSKRKQKTSKCRYLHILVSLFFVLHKWKLQNEGLNYNFNSIQGRFVTVLCT